MNISTAEAYEKLFPLSPSEPYKDEFCPIIEKLELGDNWEPVRVPPSMFRPNVAISVRWTGFPKRTLFREMADRIFVVYHRRGEDYTVLIPVLDEKTAHRYDEAETLRKLQFDSAEEVVSHINKWAKGSIDYMKRNAFVETNHNRAIRIARDPINDRFLFGKDECWSNDGDDDSVISSGNRKEAIQSIDDHLESKYSSGEMISPEDPTTAASHSPLSLIDMHGVGEETKYNVALTFGTYDNMASASLSEVRSWVSTSSYYSVDLKKCEIK